MVFGLHNSLTSIETGKERKEMFYLMTHSTQYRNRVVIPH